MPGWKSLSYELIRNYVFLETLNQYFLVEIVKYCRYCIITGIWLNHCVHMFQSSNLSIEEFHQSLQEVTNFPLRPFVLPFLRTHLPLLQREVNTLARANKQVRKHSCMEHNYFIHFPKKERFFVIKLSNLQKRFITTAK